jgi:hypothetical protein
MRIRIKGIDTWQGQHVSLLLGHRWLDNPPFEQRRCGRHGKPRD